MGNLPYRSECKCGCHKHPGMMHITACCQPDPRMTPTSDAPATVEQCDHARAAEIMKQFGYLGTRMNGGKDYQYLLRELAAHRLAALASAPAGDGVSLREALSQARQYVERKSWDAFDDREDKLLAVIDAALARPRAAVGERAWDGVVATDPCQSADDTDEDGNPCWYIEMQSVGGHSIVATVYGGSAEEVQARAAAILALQSPPAKVEG